MHNSTQASLKDGSKTPALAKTTVALHNPSAAHTTDLPSEQKDTAPQASNDTEQSIALQMALGNPSNATSDPANKANYLIQRPQYALSYNDPLGRPNWVSWHLHEGNIGSMSRRTAYSSDAALPSGFQLITPADFKGSGYDRGQSCPGQDRSSNQKDLDAAYLMTNITPMAPSMNQNIWIDFENYCRNLASKEKARGQVLKS